MVQERLAPGVGDGRDPYLCSEPFLAKLQQRLTGGGEQEGIKRALILGDEWIEQVRQGKDQMEVRHGQKRCFLFGQPLRGCLALAERTMAVAAGVRDKMRFPTVLAAVTVAAQSQSATGEQRIENAPMMLGQRGRRTLQ